MSGLEARGDLLIYPCRFSGDFNTVIAGFPVLDTELPPAPFSLQLQLFGAGCASSVGMFPHRVTSSVAVGRTDPSASHGAAPSWDAQWDPSPPT